MQKELVRGQNYPIKWNRDRDDRDLFLDGRPESAILEFTHRRWILGHNATLGEDDKAFALVKGFQRFHKGNVAAFKFCAIYGNMELAVHETKYRNVFEVILSDENRIVLVEPKCNDVHVRAVIGAEDVLPLAIEPGSVFNFERYSDKDEQQAGPPSVEFSDESELPGKNDRDEQQEKKDDKK
jgi:hypothetical protein